MKRMEKRTTPTDRAEFEQTVKLYEPTITKLCYFYAESADEVADMRQDVMLNLWRGWGSFRGESQLGTWIHRVCLNTCVSYVRRERRHRHSPASPEAIAAIADDGDDRTALWQQMHSLISRLSTRERAVVLLWLEEFSYDEIAEVIGVSRNAVATLLFRIKQKLHRLNEEKN